MSTIFDILLNQQLNNNNCKRYYKIQKQQKERKEDLISWLPELDVLETNDGLIIETELPGVNKEDINIEIKDSKLYIQGEKKKSIYKNSNPTTSTSSTASASSTLKDSKDSIDKEFEDTETKQSNEVKVVVNEQPKSNETEEGIKNHISERTFGHFKRFLDLNKIIYTLDLSSIQTSYNNGLLTISINKKQDYSNTIKINLN